MRNDHSAAFLAIRDEVLDGIDDADRRHLAQLLGAMGEPRPQLTAGVVRLLSLLVQLSPNDRHRLSRWFTKYVSRWGQIPVAASRRVATPRAGSTPVPPAHADPAESRARNA